MYEAGQLVSGAKQPLPPGEDLIPVTVDLVGEGPGDTVGYKARKEAGLVIDVDRVNAYDPERFWERIPSGGGRLDLDTSNFYILNTIEDVGVPPWLAAEMIPYLSRSGEFRVHYAGFFDPGFGWQDKVAHGSRAVLEMRSYGVPFTLEHGQTVGWLKYSKLAAEPANFYGDTIGSHYQGQRLRLSKHFRQAP
jgi:dCTP deaminase